MRKRIVSLLMAVLMLAAMVPTAAWAEEITLPDAAGEVGQEAQETPQDVQDAQDELEAQEPAAETDEPEMPPASTAEDTPALPEPETQSITDNSASVLTAESADSGTCGENLTWTLDEQGTLTISGTGMMDDYTTTPWYWYTLRNSITAIIIEDGVTSIGSCAFYDFPVLNSVTLPSSLSSIGYYAFYRSSALTSITLPRRITSIGNYAFYASSLTNITLPSHISYIGDYAFHECSSLTDIYYNNYGIDWLKCGGSKAVPDDVTVHFKDNLYGMGNCGINAKWELTADGTLTISGTGQITNYSSNWGWDNNSTPWSIANKFICKVIIERGITAIGSYAFSSCDNLTDVTIPDTVISIGNSAFRGCSALTSITLPDSVTSIGESAFEYCSKLTSITIPNSITSIGNSAFYGCSSLTSITLPDSVTSIGDSVFSDCSSLTSITIPNSVTYLGGSAFSNCSQLKEAILSDSLTGIRSSLFSNCPRLASITIPGSITSIGNDAFCCCENLKDVYFTGTKDQWAEVNIGSDNEDLLNATIHCAATLDIPTMTLTTASNGNPVIKWTKVNGAAQYEVYRSVNNKAFSIIRRTSGLTYTDVTAEADKTYYYEVRAINGCAVGKFCEAKSIKCNIVLGVPTMTLSNASSGKPAISWEKVDGAAQYEVYRSLTGKANSYNIIQRTAKLTYTDINTQVGKIYYYIVRAISSNQTGAFCSAKYIRVSAAANLATPTMTLTIASNGSPVIKWTKVDGAAQYEVYRSDTGKAGTFWAIRCTARLTYTDTSTQAGKTYYYVVRAINDGAVSWFCEAKSIVAALSVPTMTLTTASNGSPVIKWTKVTGAAQYEVYRSDTGKANSYSIVRRTAGLTYTDTSAAAGKTYYYVVRAINGSTAGKFCAAQMVLGVPTMTLTSTRNGTVIQWTKVDGATQYEVYRSDSGKSGTFKIIRRTADTSWEDDTAAAGLAYYTVRAMRGSGTSVVYGSFCSAATRSHVETAKTGSGISEA